MSLLLATVLALASGDAVSAPAGPARAPLRPGGAGEPGNVLVLLVDDLGSEWLGVYGIGASPAPTPNLDALAASGVTFTDAWSNPLCSPTRATIQTGRYSFRTGVGSLVGPSYQLPLAEVTLPEMLDLGTGGAYAHALFGKWHLGGGLTGPNDAGYGHFAGTINFTDPPFDYFTWQKVVDGAAAMVSAYATTETVDDALAWIGSVQEPWLAVAAFQAVHHPFHAPPAHLHSVDLSGAPPPEVDPLPYYRAMIEALDAEIGRLVSGLGRARDRTTIVLVSDNGSPEAVAQPPYDAEHAKNSLHQGGVRVPFVVTGPDVAAPGSTCAGLVNTTDLFATVAELAGVDLAAALPGTKLDSVSFLPYLADPSRPSLRAHAFAEKFSPPGPTYGVPAPPQTAPVCQPDLGYGGPGSLTLTLCGDVLVEDALVDLELVGAPAGALTWLSGSPIFGPTPLLGGTVVPWPPAFLLPFVADGGGTVTLVDLASVPGPFTLYLQMAAIDPSQPLGVALSNTVEATYHAWNTKAIRDVRWKLVAQVNGGPDELYDMQADPLETTDLLLAGPLAPEAQAAYDSLRQALTALVSTP